jgi:hypothetical protein
MTLSRSAFNAASFCLMEDEPPHSFLFLFSPSKKEGVKKFNSAAKSAFLVVQGTEKFAPPKSGGQE